MAKAIALTMAAALVGLADGFSTPAVSPCPRPVAAFRRPALRSEPPTMLLTLPKVLASIPTLYALMSVNEYVTHRWYQHEEFNRDHAFQRLCQRLGRLLFKRPMLLEGGRRNQ